MKCKLPNSAAAPPKGDANGRNVMVVDAIIISLSGRVLLRTTERWDGFTVNSWWVDGVGRPEVTDSTQLVGLQPLSTSQLPPKMSMTAIAGMVKPK